MNSRPVRFFLRLLLRHDTRYWLAGWLWRDAPSGFCSPICRQAGRQWRDAPSGFWSPICRQAGRQWREALFWLRDPEGGKRRRAGRGRDADAGRLRLLPAAAVLPATGGQRPTARHVGKGGPHVPLGRKGTWGPRRPAPHGGRADSPSSARPFLLRAVAGRPGVHRRALPWPWPVPPVARVARVSRARGAGCGGRCRGGGPRLRPWRAGKPKRGSAPPYMRGGAKRPRVQNPAESISPQRWESSGRPRCRSYRRRPFGWGGWGVSPPQRSLGELDIVGSFLLGWADLQSPYLTLRWRGALRALIKTPCWTPAGRVDGVGVSRFHESSRSLCSRIAGGLSVLRRGPLARWPNHVVVVGGGSGVASEPFSRPPPGTGGTQCPSRAGLRPHGRSSTTTWRGLPPSQVPKSADHADGRGSGCRSLDQCPFRARPITVDASGRSRCRVALQLHPRGRRELHFHAGLSTSTWSTAPADVGSDCCSAGFVGREVEISWGKVATWSGFPVLAASTAYPGRAARRLPQACGTCTLRRHYCGCSARRCSSTWSCSAAAQRPSCPMKNFTDVTVTLIPTPRRGLCDRRHHPRARASRCSK